MESQTQLNTFYKQQGQKCDVSLWPASITLANQIVKQRCCWNKKWMNGLFERKNELCLHFCTGCNRVIVIKDNTVCRVPQLCCYSLTPCFIHIYDIERIWTLGSTSLVPPLDPPMLTEPTWHCLYKRNISDPYKFMLYSMLKWSRSKKGSGAWNKIQI